METGFGAALTTLIQQFLYPVTDAPKFSKGFKASLGFLVGMCIWVVVVRVFEMRAVARKGTENLNADGMRAGDVEEVSEGGSSRDEGKRGGEGKGEGGGVTRVGVLAGGKA